MKKAKKLAIYLLLVPAVLILSACTTEVQTVTEITEVDESSSLSEEQTGPIESDSELETIEQELQNLQEDLDNTLPSVNDDDFE